LQALKLGRKQATWVIEQRKKKLAGRAKATAPSKPKRGGEKRTARALPEGATPARRALAARAGSSRGVLVAEGDSWFDYPFHDVLKELDDEFGWEIEHVAHKGDTIESMAYDGGQLDDFVRAIEKVARHGEAPHAILLSGGGNDIAGDGFGMLLNHRSSPVHGLDPDVIEGVLETRVRVAYTTILSAVTAACKDLLGAPVPILLHGYDHPVPDGRGFLGGWGWLPGPWLAPGFLEKGYDDLAERIAVTRDLIDRFYSVLGELVAMPDFEHVQIIDVRGALSVDLQRDRYKDWWGNELHPTRAGYRKIAGMFDDEL
jgi:lysophospholipase L1-like esterase